MSKFKNVEEIMSLPFPLSYPYFMFCMTLMGLSIFIWLAFAGRVFISRSTDSNVGFFWVERREFAQFSGIGAVHDDTKTTVYKTDDEEQKKKKANAAVEAKRVEKTEEKPRRKMTAVELLEERRRKRAMESKGQEQDKTPKATKQEESGFGESIFSGLFSDSNESKKNDALGKVVDANEKDRRSVVGTGRRGDFSKLGMRFYFPRSALRNWMRTSAGMSMVAIIMLVFRMFSYKRFMDAQADLLL